MQLHNIKITSETSLSGYGSTRPHIVFVGVILYYCGAKYRVQIVQCSPGQNLRYISGDTETVSLFLPSTSAHAASLLQIYQTFLLYDTCRL